MQDTSCGGSMSVRNTMVISRSKKINKRVVSSIHYHREYELYYMLDGGTNYLIGDELYSISRGEFVFIPQGVPHQTDNQSCRFNERILISFDERLFNEQNQDVLTELEKTRVIRVPDIQLPLLEELLFKIESEYKQNEKGKSILLALYIQELLTLIYRYKCDRKHVFLESDKIAYTVSEYIRENYAQDITLKSLSKTFAISEGHLSRKFKEVSGLCVKQYITHVRISHAAMLLSQSSLSVTDVAEQCGFCGSTYFSSVFRKIKGVTPMTYRKQGKNHCTSEQ